VREIVIVIADLFWAASHSPETELSLPPGALPGLSLAARFGQTAWLPESWLGWLARWLGRDELADLTPASAAALLAQAALPAAGNLPGGGWIATPVHLLAGISSVHLDRRGVLRLPPADARQLAADFGGTFGDSPFRLAVLPPADLLLVGPYLHGVKTVEPARAVLSPLGQSQPRGEQAVALRRLNAELEMWLHGHAINHARARRGEPLVSSLWLWGGGALPSSAAPAPHRQGDIAFADDVRARGLWQLTGGDCWPVPDTLEDVLSYAEVDRAAVVVEAGPVLQSHPRWTLVEALGALDLHFIGPALQALRTGRLASVVLLANGCSLTVRAKDLRRWWRAKRSPLAGLTA
jgi:hypothetical protein